MDEATEVWELGSRMSRTLKKGVIQTEASYIRDGGRPSGGALQREPPNHRTLLRLRAAVARAQGMSWTAARGAVGAGR